MKCHLPIGELFRDWLAEEVVPAIRENGQYKLQEALSDSMAKLELKDKEVEEERKQRLRAETKAITLERLNIAFKERQKTSVFYIKTSTVMARDNEFKIGGVESMDKLKNRLKDYESGNSGVHPELTNHFVFVREVADYKQIESRMADLLKPFRSKRHGNSENYNIHYKILSALATMVIDNYDQEIDKFNDFIKVLLEKHKFDKPVVPDFIDIDALPHFVELSLTRRQFGSATGTKVKLGDLGDEELKNVLRQVIMSIDISDSNVVRRQTVETILSETYNLQAQKRRTWEITKPLLEEAGRVPRY